MSTGVDRGRWLYGPEGQCARTDVAPPRPLRIVLLGAPGVGKGTQAELICRERKTCQLSTGDVFRAALCSGAREFGGAMKAALESMRRGELVSDSTVIELVRERLHCLTCDYGFILDGFPRTVEQAEALDELLDEEGISLDATMNYDLPLEEVVKRLSGRRTCRECKTTFHVVHKPPLEEGVCDQCGGELYQRDDDHPESIRVRLDEYRKSTAPLAEYYERKGLLRTISAAGPPGEVFERTVAVLDGCVKVS